MLTLSKLKSSFSSKVISKEQSKDTGLALALILLLIGYFTGNTLYYRLVIPVLLIVMTVPQVFYYPAIGWFGIAMIVGNFMSGILLTIVFFVVVFPVALIRKLVGKDSLRLKQFHKSKESVMNVRNHVYNRSDIEKPY